MKITTIRSAGLAHLSYFVSSKSEAMVIDPRRDCDIYVELANSEEANIVNIFETHRNEDYVTGSLELQELVPNSRIGHSNATNFGFGDDSISDEESFRVGEIRITALQTPGHTNDSICYAVSDSSMGPDILVLFTGDTLFVNEVGRTDLVDLKKHEAMSRRLWHSLHERILPLGDGVIIYPGHGAGSVCGGAIGRRDFSTIGYERRNNIWLAMEEEEFVQTKMKQKLTKASYFKRCEALNTNGPPLLADLPPLEHFKINAFEETASSDNCVILDTRPATSFAQEHIPGSISLDMNRLGLSAGWVLSKENQFLFILESLVYLQEACGMLYRVGLDSIVGYLGGGYATWKNSGKKSNSLPIYRLEEISKGLSDKSLQLVDVRQPHETEVNYIAGSLFAPLSMINENIPSLDKNIPIVTICQAGVRSTTAASILKRVGFSEVGVTESGMDDWMARGYPMGFNLNG